MTISLNGSTGIVTPEVEGRVIDENGFQVFGGDPENRIINGAFDFWQRGTSFTTEAYGADRWRNGVFGGVGTQTRQTFSLGDTLGSNSPTYFLRQTVSGQSATNHLAYIHQRIEDVRSYAGQTITILGWARRSSGAGNMAVQVEQFFGTGGTPSARVGMGGQTVLLTSSFAPFAVTFNVPSITGKTLGTDGNNYFQLNFWTSSGSEYNLQSNSLGIQTIGVDLWGIHIKVGIHTAAATEFYKAPELGPDLARCQRYYEIGSTRWRAADNNGATVWANYFKVTKRGLPSMAGDTNIGSSLLNTSAFSLQRQASGTVDTGTINWTADAEL